MVDFGKEKLDILIQGGQSNAEGCGLGAVAQEYLPSPDVLYLNAPKNVNVIEVEGRTILDIKYFDEPFEITPADYRLVNGEKCGDFALSFAKKYVESGCLMAGRKLLIIRAGIGGTGFQKGHWGMQDPVYLKMMEMIAYALSLNSENKIVGFFWQQGEHDAFEGNPPENYHKQMNALLGSVREQFGENIPFITADFVSDWKSKNFGICQPIVNVLRQVVKENPLSAFVKTEDLLSNDQMNKNGDDIHFCRESLRILGLRYFDEFIKLSAK